MASCMRPSMWTKWFFNMLSEYTESDRPGQAVMRVVFRLMETLWLGCSTLTLDALP